MKRIAIKNLKKGMIIRVINSRLNEEFIAFLTMDITEKEDVYKILQIKCLKPLSSPFPNIMNTPELWFCKSDRVYVLTKDEYIVREL